MLRSTLEPPQPPTLGVWGGFLMNGISEALCMSSNGTRSTKPWSEEQEQDVMCVSQASQIPPGWPSSQDHQARLLQSSWFICCQIVQKNVEVI